MSVNSINTPDNEELVKGLEIALDEFNRIGFKVVSAAVYMHIRLLIVNSKTQVETPPLSDITISDLLEGSIILPGDIDTNKAKRVFEHEATVGDDPFEELPTKEKISILNQTEDWINQERKKLK